MTTDTDCGVSSGAAPILLADDSDVGTNPPRRLTTVIAPRLAVCSESATSSTTRSPSRTSTVRATGSYPTRLTRTVCVSTGTSGS